MSTQPMDIQTHNFVAAVQFNVAPLAERLRDAEGGIALALGAVEWQAAKLRDDGDISGAERLRAAVGALTLARTAVERGSARAAIVERIRVEYEEWLCPLP